MLRRSGIIWVDKGSPHIMKIAIVTYALQVGGIETFIKLLADYFHEQGHEVIIIETLKKGSWSNSFSESGLHVEQILPKFYQSRIRHVKFIAEKLATFDVIIINDAPYAQSIIGLLPEKIVVFPVLHSNLTSMINNAVANSENWDRLCTVSPFLKECAELFGADEKKVVCIPNGVKIADEWPKKDRFFSSDQPLSIIYVGAINHFQKGVFYLPGIMREVIAKNSNVKLDIVGFGADMEELRRRFAEESNINPVFHGMLSHEEAMALLNQADVIIMPSHFEGFGLVMIEAMARGVVPVVSRLSGCTDCVVSDGVDGYLIDVGDEKNFARNILLLAQNRNILREFSYACWEKAYTHFSCRRMASEYLTLAEQCIAEHSENGFTRSNKTIEMKLLGDLPWLPILFMRPARKILRQFGLYSIAKNQSPVFFPN
jgi:glycosyltransferase involved in cell wall biosynthesis